MKYLLMIYASEANDSAMGAGDRDAEYKAYYAYTEVITTEGINLGGHALNPVSTATTVRVRDGETMVTDGPFAETKEQLGGFYIVDCEDLDQAISAAARIPTAKHGSIEVRPVWEFDDPAA